MPQRLAPAVANAGHTPKISVLIPTYNYARYLPEAIESVLAQDRDDYEILISDDASTDDSARIIRHYATIDSRIRFVIHPRNLGMVANWNSCLEQARGEYVKFIFGDDLLASPNALRSYAEMLDQQPGANLAASARILVDDNTRMIGLWDNLAPGIYDGPRLIARCLRTRRNLIGEPSAVMFRRASAERGFDPDYRQMVDLEMWLHQLLQGRLAYTSVPLCAFRQHDEQQTAVNHRSHLPYLELLHLVNRYISIPSVQAHLRAGSLAHRLLLFRQAHYTRKAAALRPELTDAVNALTAELSRPWTFVLWLCHRAMRPIENLQRKTISWTRKLKKLFHSRAMTDHGQWAEFSLRLPVNRDRGRPASARAARPFQATPSNGLTALR
jgi:glycosyltransferase involved in cell wall biosynthesis